MNITDKRGNPVSYGSQKAIERLDGVCDMMHAYQADPLAEVDAIIAEYPDFALAHAFRAGALATATDKAFEPELIKSLNAAEALARKANERERLHIAACRAWLDGEWGRAIEAWGRASTEYPRDLLALQFAHLGDFYLGHSHLLRDRIARVLQHWDRSIPGYGFVEGMYAFGLEESGEYAKAEERGRRAVALNGQDGWAVHAVTHVMEMQGRADEGADYLAASAEDWAPNSMFAFHLWWHQALFRIEANDTVSALKLFDESVSAGGFGQALELVDGSSLLWRLWLIGQDVGDRWTDLADKWEARAEDAYYAFNDVNAMIAFVGAGRADTQSRLISAAKRAAAGQGTNAMMSREVGVPACEGLAAFGRGDYAQAIEYLLPVRGKANRMGGSHAQRDLFSWTLTEAAIRLGDRELTDAFVAERLSWKPESRINRAWATRSEQIQRKRSV
ncbi:tetratricopeptide repeat protein [Candidatus Nitrospira neomarina]|uniref:Tetratricopeptide repeat protein 38 n=1 Tax=Candidatus Nitrospira neomarina TaxID=3020899 RepID=A0AA96GLW2_9BACT|nr:tetratricopeptide repeat protein [Candidatus Nitrospira neomarina]WNM63697.1 tetratricopeptide repeat protein [Candidatus Nitrospira neomarina]